MCSPPSATQPSTCRTKTPRPLRVHETYEPIQVFSLRAPEDVGALLESLRADASVVTEDALQRGARATRVLTLVTCSTGNANTSQRTLLVFCADV